MQAGQQMWGEFAEVLLLACTFSVKYKVEEDEPSHQLRKEDEEEVIGDFKYEIVHCQSGRETDMDI